MVAVALQGVGKNLSGRAILHPLDLQVEKGEFVVVIGPLVLGSQPYCV